MDRTKSDFYSNRGFAYRKLQKYQLAVSDYTECISLNPSIFFNMQIISKHTTTEQCAMKSLEI